VAQGQGWWCSGSGGAVVQWCSGSGGAGARLLAQVVQVVQWLSGAVAQGFA